MAFFKLLTDRWTRNSPAIFVKIQNFGIALTASGTAGVAVPSIPSVHFPPIISTVSGYMIVAGFCIGLVAKLTVQDPAKPDTTTSKV